MESRKIDLNSTIGYKGSSDLRTDQSNYDQFSQQMVSTPAISQKIQSNNEYLIQNNAIYHKMNDIVDRDDISPNQQTDLQKELNNMYLKPKPKVFVAINPRQSE